jgi:hypothetical protein
MRVHEFRGCGWPGIAVVSTSEGVMTDVQARRKNLGGEVLCYVGSRIPIVLGFYVKN